MARKMQCSWTGKELFFTADGAKRHRDFINKHTHNRMQIYKCAKCNYFHLFSRKKKREKPDERLPSGT